jgi:DNA repair protein RadD
MDLRPYQIKLETDINNAWRCGHRNILGVLPTGGGKTYTFSDILLKHDGYKVAIAHRQELVSQISLSLATYGIMHRIIAPKKVAQWIAALHVRELGQNFINQNSPTAVIGVDTLIRGKTDFEDFAKKTTLWIIDEAHHVLRENKWGKAVAMFPNAKGLGVTATPVRADGKGLGAHHDGVFHSLIQGPTMRELIEQDYLCDYRIFAPPSDIDLSDVPIGASGDYSQKKMIQAARRSHIVGDVVSHYLKIAEGKQGITFATDVETAGNIAKQFKTAGIRAEVIHGKTPDNLRIHVIRQFRRKEIQQIVNVDILGEGFDVPGIEVVSMARPTKSYGLYCQQFGRGLRKLEGKEHAIIIDHVNNVDMTRGGHGLPDAPRKWSLDRRGSKKKERDPDIIPVRACQECTSLYLMTFKACPYCGHVHEPPLRTGPEFVEGDLTELTPATLAEMRGEIERVDSSVETLIDKMRHAGAAPVVINSAAKNHKARQSSQKLLRESIAWWRAHQAPSCTDSEAYRLFYFRFGVDVASAQTLGAREAEELAININKTIDAIVNAR